jgi:hypothetical protein
VVKSIRNFTDKGVLHPRIDEHGNHRFDPDEVSLLQRTRNVAAKRGVSTHSRASKQRDIFTCFRNGMSHVDIVIQCNVELKEVQYLYETYSGNKSREQAAIEQQEAAAKKERAERLARLREMVAGPKPTPTQDGDTDDRKRRQRRKRSK